VTGSSWADAVRARITEPLGMHSTSVIGTSSVPGYVLENGSFVDATTRWHPSLGGAAGGMQSRDRDLLLFATALEKGTLLSPASQAAMQAFVPAEDLSRFGIVHGYGLGLERYELDAVTVLGHLGTGGAHASFFGYDSAHHTAVAVMMNAANPGPQGVMAVEALTGAAQAPGG
jgi:D-alanyl-D-alanine carboxypeptidase